MDDLIARLSCRRDGDLMVADGVAWQADMSGERIAYDARYLAKCEAYADSEISAAVNAGRCALMMRHMPEGASVLDFGAGSGQFMRVAKAWGLEVCGFDVIPETVERLASSGQFADDVAAFSAITAWDVLEHLEDPFEAIRRIRRDCLLFVSVPVFDDLSRIRESRHYRPGEHLYYWTADGFIGWMAQRGFHLLESSDHEVKAGRDSIGAFAFRRTTPTCPCGGETWADSFDWPGKARQWFLRCQRCGGMSESSADRASAEAGVITHDQAMEPSSC